MLKKNLSLLLAISKKTGLYSEQTLTTNSLAGEWGISQQSVSRKLRVLEKEEYIQRTPTVDGIGIRLRKKAVDELRQCLIDTKELFEKGRKKNMSIKGRVFSGLGEGRFYTEQRGYKSQFIRKLGINPFPGTLNLRVDKAERDAFLSSRKSVMVEAFRNRKRTFGWIRAYPVKVGSIKAAAVIPERTLHNSDTIELISKKYLRKALKLKDNNRVTIK